MNPLELGDWQRVLAWAARPACIRTGS